MENKVLSTKGITEIAIFTAIAFALDALQGGLWRGVFTNGGSIGLAMIPIIILCYRRGYASALISAFILAFLQMLGGIYAIADTWYKVLFQICLDYIFAYPCVAFAGLFYRPFQNAQTHKQKCLWICVGVAIGGIAKFLCHFLAGVLFWQNFDFPGGPAVYSLVYNGAYMLPNIILTAVIVCLVEIKQPNIFILKKKEDVVVMEGETNEQAQSNN